MFRTLHTSFLRFKKDSKSAVSPSTEAALLTGSINDADSSIEEEEEEEEETYFDAEDFLRGELDCFPQITPPTIVFDAEDSTSRASDEQTQGSNERTETVGLTVPSSVASERYPDDVSNVTRISSARKVSILEVSISLSIHLTIGTAYHFQDLVYKSIKSILAVRILLYKPPSYHRRFSIY